MDDAMGHVELSTAGDEVKSHWAKYLCVLLYGMIEECVRVTLTRYAYKRSDPRCAAFIESQVDRPPSPEPEKLCAFVAEFDAAWGEQLREFLEEESEREGALVSVVSNRHLIAHGRDSGVTYEGVHKWYPKIVEFVDYFATLCA